MYQMDEDPNRHVGEFIALLQAVLQAYDDERHMGKLTMQKLYAEVQDWDSLAKNIQRQAEVLEDPEEQIRINAAAGELF